MELKPLDILSPSIGTTVKQVDADGNLIGGVFKAVSWSTRNRQVAGGGCPQWLDQIVISQTIDGARAGAGLVGPSSAGASSSSSSRDVIAIQVNNNGQEVTRFVVPYTLVGRFAQPQKNQALPVAEELWFSNQPFNPRNTQFLEAETACNAEAAPPSSSGAVPIPSSRVTS